MRLVAGGIALLILLAGCAGDDPSPEDLVVDPGDGPSATATAGSSASGGATPAPGGSDTPPAGNGTNSTAPGPADNTPPEASLAANATQVPVGGAVTFTLGGTDDDGDALAWTLDLGDGTSETGDALPAEVSHAFAAAGDHTVTLTVTDGTDEAQATVLVAVQEVGPALCEVDDEVSAGDLFYLHDRGAEGGTWLYEESNSAPGLQLSAEASEVTGDTDPLGAGCVNGDTLIF